MFRGDIRPDEYARAYSSSLIDEGGEIKDNRGGIRNRSVSLDPQYWGVFHEEKPAENCSLVDLCIIGVIRRSGGVDSWAKHLSNIYSVI